MSEEFWDEIAQSLEENGEPDPTYIRLAKAEQRIRELEAMNRDTISNSTPKAVKPGSVYKGFSEANVSHFRVFVDVVGSRNVWFDVVGRYGETESRKMSLDEFMDWVSYMEVLNVGLE